jgi:hypothetical protein
VKNPDPRNRKAGLTDVSPASPGERREEIKSIIFIAEFMPKLPYNYLLIIYISQSDTYQRVPTKHPEILLG